MLLLHASLPPSCDGSHYYLKYCYTGAGPTPQFERSRWLFLFKVKYSEGILPSHLGITSSNTCKHSLHPALTLAFLPISLPYVFKDSLPRKQTASNTLSTTNPSSSNSINVGVARPCNLASPVLIDCQHSPGTGADSTARGPSRVHSAQVLEQVFGRDSDQHHHSNTASSACQDLGLAYSDHSTPE